MWYENTSTDAAVIFELPSAWQGIFISNAHYSFISHNATCLSCFCRPIVSQDSHRTVFLHWNWYLKPCTFMQKNGRAWMHWWMEVKTGKPLIFLSLGVISAGMLWVCMRAHAHTSRALLINMAPVGRNRYRLTFSAQLPTLPQSALLITTGTFHTVLDLINDFSSPPPSLHIPRSCSPCSLSRLLTFLLLSR